LSVRPAWRRGVAGLLPGDRAVRRPPGLRNSVAVLPFKNLSGDEASISPMECPRSSRNLARNLKLQVMAQASSAIFRDRKEDAVTIASTRRRLPPRR
jgi:TolB-like protein